MQTVILCGGEGTRLKPLTDNLPKPLVKILGEPALKRLLRDLNRCGIKTATLCTRYLSEKIEDALGSSCEGVTLKYSKEDYPLGTAGCVRNVFDGGDALILSGDGVTGFDYKKIIEFHRSKSADITIVCREVSDPREYGLVTVSGDRISGFLEKPGYDKCLTNLANTGCYVISSDVIKSIPQGEPADFARDVFPAALKAGKRLFAYRDNTFWHDVGDIPSLLSCQRDLLSQEKKDNLIFDSASVAPGCTLNSCVLEPGSSLGANSRAISSLIGRDSVIADGADLSEAVISEHCTAGSGLIMMKNSVLGEGSVVGSGVVVCEGVRVSPGSKIRDGAIIRTDLNPHSGTGLAFSESGRCEGVSGTLEYVRLGMAAVSALNIKRAVLGGGGEAYEPLSLGMRYSGADVFTLHGSTVGEAVFAARRLECDYVFFAADTPMIFSAYTVDIERADERKIERLYERFESKKTTPGNLISADPEAEAYIARLKNLLPKNLGGTYGIRAENPRENYLFNKIFGEHTGEKTIFTVAPDSLTVTAKDGENVLSYENLLILASASNAEIFGETVLFPEAPELCDFYAGEHGGKVAREPSKSAPVSGFCYDPTELIVLVVKYLSDRGISLSGACSELRPLIYTRSVIEVPEGLPKLLADGFKESRAGRELRLDRDGAKAYIRPMKSGRAMKLYIESVSLEAAEELSADILKRLSLN